MGISLMFQLNMTYLTLFALTLSVIVTLTGGPLTSVNYLNAELAETL